jgi:hypothetical protein
MNSNQYAIYSLVGLLLAAPLAAEEVLVRGGGGRVVVTAGNGYDVAGAALRRIDAQHVEVVATAAEARVTVPASSSLRFEAEKGEIVVIGIAGNIEAKTARANVVVRGAGGNLIVSTGNGNVTADGVRGLVEVITGNGNVTVTNPAGGVRVVSINGKTDIVCPGGAVSVRDTSGKVRVTNARGDVDVFTALGQATYEGALQPARAYNLRTLDGAVTLSWVPSGAGFSALLASDAMQIDADPQVAEGRKRVETRWGDERARVVLDAVGGRVELQRIAAAPACGSR